MCVTKLSRVFFAKKKLTSTRSTYWFRRGGRNKEERETFFRSNFFFLKKKRGARSGKNAAPAERTTHKRNSQQQQQKNRDLFHTHTHYQLVLRKLSHNTRHTHARQGVKKKEILEKNNAVVLHTFPTHTHTSKLFFFSTEHITKTGPQKQKLTKNFREIKQKSLFPLHQTYTTHTLSLFALDNSQCYLFLLISFVFLWFFSSSFRPLPRGCCKTDRLFLTRALNCIITEKKNKDLLSQKKI